MRYLPGILFASLLAVCLPRPVAAWGEDGHKIVCAIAYQLLNKADKAEVDRLSRLYRQPDGSRFPYFTVSCNFADLARTKARGKASGWSRFAEFEDWHFLNIPRSTATIPASACDGNCVLQGIEHHRAQLASTSSNDQARAEALMFLGHWVGDIHQPLHVSFADDRGGNAIKPIRGIYSSGDLHAVWDTGIITAARQPGDWWSYASTLRQRIDAQDQQQWSAGPPLSWAQESYEITTSPDVHYCKTVAGECSSIPGERTLRQAYQKRMAPLVERRLQQGGTRLAALIQTALHP